MERLSFPLEGKTEVRRNWLGAVRKLRLKTLDKNVHLQVPSDHVLSEADGTGCIGVSPFGRESQIRLKSDESNCCFKVQQQFEELECRAVPSDMGQREDEQQQKIMEATVCAKNSKVSSTGEKVVLWTRYVLVHHILCSCYIVSAVAYLSAATVSLFSILLSPLFLMSFLVSSHLSSSCSPV